MRSYAIPIDAGFLKRKRGSQENPVTTEKILEFVGALQGHAALRSLRLHCIYYHDAPPLRDSVKRSLGGRRDPHEFRRDPVGKAQYRP